MASQLSDITAQTREFISRDHKILINGDWRLTNGGVKHSIIDPSTGEQIGEFCKGDVTDVDAAIQAARDSFDAGQWRETLPATRAKTLLRLAALIDAHQQELAELESIDGGKPISAAFNGEVPAAAEAFRYHAGWCTKIEGRTFQPSISGLELRGSTYLEPIGVAGLITPWNGPLVMAAWKLAPALAAGCSVVLKPAENTVLSTLRLGELIGEAGFPAGVVNIVTGSGAVVGDAIAADIRVDKVSFTGSTETARKLIHSAQSNLKKLSLELGGKSPVLIFDDANIEEAIKGAADGIFSNAGQVCVAGSRILIQKSIYDRVVEGLVAHAEKIKLGNSMDDATQMGPLISAAHRDSVDRYVQLGAEQGATIVAGGKFADRPGFFYLPTILTDEKARSCVWTDEIFGPVATVTSFEDEADALSLANASQYGLAASVWTENASRIQRLTRAIRAGIVWVNCHGIPDMAMPIGGYKQSGWGREHGWRGIEAYLEHKSVMHRVF